MLQVCYNHQVSSYAQGLGIYTCHHIAKTDTEGEGQGQLNICPSSNFLFVFGRLGEKCDDLIRRKKGRMRGKGGDKKGYLGDINLEKVGTKKFNFVANIYCRANM